MNRQTDGVQSVGRHTLCPCQHRRQLRNLPILLTSLPLKLSLGLLSGAHYDGNFALKYDLCLNTACWSKSMLVQSAAKHLAGSSRTLYYQQHLADSCFDSHGLATQGLASLLCKVLQSDCHCHTLSSCIALAGRQHSDCILLTLLCINILQSPLPCKLKVMASTHSSR